MYFPDRFVLAEVCTVLNHFLRDRRLRNNLLTVDPLGLIKTDLAPDRYTPGLLHGEGFW